MISYSEPIWSTYTIPAAAIITAGNLLSVIGPPGLKGHLYGIGAVITTATTVAASIIQVGDGTTATKYGSLSVPVGAANVAVNSATLKTTDKTKASVVIIAADARLVIGTDGGSTLGAADITVTVAWF